MDSNNNYTRQWRDEHTLEKYDLARKETWREHILPRVTENEQVKIPTWGHQSPDWSDIIALKKSDGSSTWKSKKRTNLSRISVSVTMKLA